MLTPRRCDVAVVGLGGVGSQAALHLARAGADVVGLDAHRPPHALGSTHGESRAIREAIFEGPQYVPLVRRAFSLWEELERELGEELLTVTGCVAIGPQGGKLLTGLQDAAAAHAIPLDALSDADRATFTVPAGFGAHKERRAGWLRPERAVAGTLRLAASAGAELRLGTRVTAVERGGPGPVRLRTDLGPDVEAEQVVLVPGPWAPELVPELAPVLRVERQVLLWFAAPGVQPRSIWIAEHATGHAAYGFPRDHLGLKLALHGDGEPTLPEEVDRTLRAQDVTALRDAVRPILGELGAVTHSTVCLYTTTADEHFALGRLDARTVAVSACSGHGFKHTPATGEAAAALALGRTPPVDVSAFDLARLI